MGKFRISVILFTAGVVLYIRTVNALPISSACTENMRKISVVYSPLQVAKSEHNVSKSPEKPALLINDLRAQNFPIEIIDAPALQREDFYSIHSRPYVDGILNRQLANGFGNKSKAIADSLPYTSGSLFKGAVEALAKGLACSPTSGFHHAGYGRASGFCTFNGLMIASKKLIKEQGVSRIAIIDADQHFGDGTEDLIDLHQLDDQIFHYSFGFDFGFRSRGQQDTPEKYLERMRLLQGNLQKFKPEIILYQAGADPHVDDPLGGILTTEQIYQRDLIMFKIARDEKIPIVWNLAGGYQKDSAGTIQPVIDIHLNTFRAAQKIFHGK